MRNRTDHVARGMTFIDRSTELYGDRYDYTQTQYTNSYTPIRIICKLHGQFNLAPKQHIAGSGCPVCVKTQRVDTIARTLKFIKRSTATHGDKYEYSKVKYVNSYTSVEIVCKLHGSFMQQPRVHVNGCGCRLCASDKRNINIEKFVERGVEVHNNQYDYSLVLLKEAKDKVEIICPIHGAFEQVAALHLAGKECKQCANVKRTLTKEQFIEKCRRTHGDKYEYSNTLYINTHTKVIVTCPTHGDFIVVAGMHQRRTGCPSCNINYSRGNFMIKQYLQDHNIEYIEEHRFDNCRSKYPLPFDFYVPSYNILIEFDGKQHYEPIIRGKHDTFVESVKRFELTINHDNIKSDYATKNNIKLVRIPYTEIKSIAEILDVQLH